MNILQSLEQGGFRPCRDFWCIPIPFRCTTTAIDLVTCFSGSTMLKSLAMTHSLFASMNNRQASCAARLTFLQRS